MGPSGRNLCENDANMEANGCLWEHLGALKGLPNHLGDGWGIALGLVGCGFREIFWKSVFLRFRCPSRAEWLLVQVRASKLEPCGPKNRARTVQSGFEGQVRAKFGRSVRGPLSELWKLPANRRTAAQTQVKSEVKVYLSDKSYD